MNVPGASESVPYLSCTAKNPIYLDRIVVTEIGCLAVISVSDNIERGIK